MTKLNLLSMLELQLKQAAQKGVAASAMPGLQKNLADLVLSKDTILKRLDQQAQSRMQGTPSQPTTLEGAEKLVASGRVPAQFQAEAMKEIEGIKKVRQTILDVRKEYDKAKRISAVDLAASKLNPAKTKSETDFDLVNAAIERAVRENRPPGQGPMSDEDAKAIIAPYKINKLDSKAVIEKKQKAFEDFLSSKFSNSGTLGTYGIKIAAPVASGFNSTGRKVK
jgi:hypothetical protein